ncbi:cytoplasmic protein [Desulfovibrio aminophilus]|uniref:cytoplasmic protein n=1 Tax=Desulfovibrio aminophilus TaxID=81425 RepID=UPI00339B9209
MSKVLLVAFRGDLLCFVHVLLNALDMKERGADARILFEGASVTLVAPLADPSGDFHKLYAKAKAAGLIEGACRACSAKLGALEAVQAEGLPLLDEMNGHPALGRYLAEGRTILTF